MPTRAVASSTSLVKSAPSLGMLFTNAVRVTSVLVLARGFTVHPLPATARMPRSGGWAQLGHRSHLGQIAEDWLGPSGAQLGQWGPEGMAWSRGAAPHRYLQAKTEFGWKVAI